MNPLRTSYWSLYRPLTDGRSRTILAVAIVCSLAAGAPLPIIGVIFGSIINSFPPPEDQLVSNIGALLGVAVAYFLVTWVCAALPPPSARGLTLRLAQLWAICWGITGECVSRRLREALLERALGMEMTYFDVEDPDLSSMLTADTQTIQMGTSEKVGLFLQSMAYFIGTFIVGFILNPALTGVLLAAIIPSTLIVVISGTTAVSTLARRAAKLTEDASEVAEGAINALQVVQAFGANKILTDEHVERLRKAGRTAFKKSIAGALMLASVFFIAYSANALAFYYGSTLVTGGNAGTIYAVVFLVVDASLVVSQFGPFIQTFALAASAGGKIYELLDAPEQTINSYSTEGIKCDADTFKDDIVFEDVSFAYPARPSAPILKNVSLRFRAGATTGVVGSSGSGKSTTVSLLLRLYDPGSGCVRIGDRDIRDYHLASLRSQIALVDQDPVLFTGTIMENISCGLRNVHRMSDAEVLARCQQAIKDANADFVEHLTQGIYTKVGGSGGTSLSGGQRQRICLARALVREPSLLLLDEPTSALDSKSESLILSALKKVSKTGCTVIMIAHRLATIKDSDNIVVMGEGQVLEQGTHAELLEIDGGYRSLVNAQQMRPSEGNMIPQYIPPNIADLPLISQQAQNESEKATVSTRKSGRFSRAKSEHAPKDLGEAQETPERRKQKRGTLEILRRAFRLSKPDTFWILLGVAASIVTGGIIVGESVVFGHLISLLNSTSNTASIQGQINFYCLLFFILGVVALLGYSISGTAFGLVNENLISRVRDISLRTILRQDLSWFSGPQNSTHHLMASMNMDASHISGLSGVIIGTIFSVVTSIVGALILSLIIAWKIAVVLLATVPVVVVAGFLRLYILGKFEERHETAYNEAAAIGTEAVAGIRTVAAFGREQDTLEKYRHAIKEPYKKSFKFNVGGNLILAFSYAITYFVYALAFWWGAQQVRNGSYSEEVFFIVLRALLFSAQIAGSMFSLAPELTRAASAANNIFELHDQKPTIMIEDDESRTVQAPFEHVHGEKDAPQMGELAGDDGHRVREGAAIDVSNVTLRYPSRPEKPALREADFSIRPGQFIGIVGPSGAGKSTIISLLERFYEPSEGNIFMDDEDIRDMPVHDHRARLSLVAQEPDLFPGSIFFNVSLGAPPGYSQQVTIEDVEEVCKMTGLHDFIISLPEGYSTDCGTNGSKLSGGQKQRLAIARALIRNPKVLLLDEATASLDSRSEQEVQKAINKAAGHRTTIVVAHRLSTVQHADCIFVFDHGQLVEKGQHRQLVAKDGLYGGMVKAQRLDA